MNYNINPLSSSTPLHGSVEVFRALIAETMMMMVMDVIDLIAFGPDRVWGGGGAHMVVLPIFEEKRKCFFLPSRN
jgi:hypothetical protein